MNSAERLMVSDMLPTEPLENALGMPMYYCLFSASDYKLISANNSDQPLTLNIHENIGDKYELISFMAWGSSGEVWRACMRGTGFVLAVKIMKEPGYSQKASTALEIARLISATGSDCDELFCDVIDSGIHKSHHFIVFTLGSISLAVVLGESCTVVLENSQKYGILWQLGRGIQYLHRMAIIHTDLKPDNIIFVDDATVNVYDVDDDGLFFEKVALHESVLVVLLLSALV
ncbi:hypothetical protein D9619_001298 [Psilocybe cf. subviscida]|uniref:Protein kinase domain-containing protein n=1 Tax=Psilocybe cf. subviscida TaxID=2480587 RepID=A0A8H5BFZ3_9AGAR|nr:hypothetical protein D9619_001298 [Psilocybe cf. subviscida]